MAVTYTFRQGDLLKLDLQVDRGSDFATWKLQWDSYHSLSGLAEQGAAKQVQALTLCFSRDTLSIVQNLGLTEEQRGSVENIISTVYVTWFYASEYSSHSSQQKAIHWIGFIDLHDCFDDG